MRRPVDTCDPLRQGLRRSHDKSPSDRHNSRMQRRPWRAFGLALPSSGRKALSRSRSRPTALPCAGPGDSACACCAMSSSPGTTRRSKSAYSNAPIRGAVRFVDRRARLRRRPGRHGGKLPRRSARGGRGRAWRRRPSLLARRRRVKGRRPGHGWRHPARRSARRR
jgi:hypothetical protein